MTHLGRITDAALEAALDAANGYRISGPGVPGLGWWVMRHRTKVEECTSEAEAVERLRAHKLAAMRRALYAMTLRDETRAPEGPEPAGASDEELRTAAATLLADWRRPEGPETWRWESALDWMTMEAQAGRYQGAVSVLLARLAHDQGETFQWPQPQAAPWP